MKPRMKRREILSLPFMALAPAPTITKTAAGTATQIVRHCSETTVYYTCKYPLNYIRVGLIVEKFKAGT